ncbi:putative basic proline-rich protein-like [Iris pallida]|uniref:Basic proline-rich protein-like n=1 Tax=Iris pallida TaxID=29817 RepID=A0AAX6DW39_IRIPA|nr:putative basic proline-rich protein-like [Iris pallida]
MIALGSSCYFLQILFLYFFLI